MSEKTENIMEFLWQKLCEKYHSTARTEHRVCQKGKTESFPGNYFFTWLGDHPIWIVNYAFY